MGFPPPLIFTWELFSLSLSKGAFPHFQKGAFPALNGGTFLTFTFKGGFSPLSKGSFSHSQWGNFSYFHFQRGLFPTFKRELFPLSMGELFSLSLSLPLGAWGAWGTGKGRGYHCLLTIVYIRIVSVQVLRCAFKYF